MKKTFITANQLLNDAYLLGFRIIDSGFRPDLLMAIWRGGTPVGIAIQELFAYHGYEQEHFPLRTRHYSGIGQRHDQVRIDDLDTILKRIRKGQKILLADDVFDTGRSIDALLTAIEQHFGCGEVEVRVATPYFKPGNNLTARTPDYYLHTTSNWLVFPHELVGLDAATIIANKPEIPALARLGTDTEN